MFDSGYKPGPFTPAYVQISYGTVTSYTSTEGQTTTDNTDLIGTTRFFVEVVGSDGSALGLWDGPDYEGAIREAERHRLAWEIGEPVHDRVAGGAR